MEWNLTLIMLLHHKYYFCGSQRVRNVIIFSNKAGTEAIALLCAPYLYFLGVKKVEVTQ